MVLACLLRLLVVLMEDEMEGAKCMTPLVSLLGEEEGPAARLPRLSISLAHKANTARASSSTPPSLRCCPTLRVTAAIREHSGGDLSK